MRSDSGRNDPNAAPPFGVSHEQDRRVVDELFTTYYPSLVRFARGYVHSLAIAEELAQDAFVKLWEFRDALEHAESIRAWLYTTVRRLALNHLKHQHVREAYDVEWMREHAVTSVPPLNSIERHRESKELTKAIERAVMNLPEKSRTTFTLHRYEGLTYEEIARVLDISVKTVESRMTRTLKKLRSELSSLLVVALIALLSA